MEKKAHQLENPPFNMAHFEALNWNRNVKVFNQGEADNKYWVLALSEELGELAGALKKMERGWNEREWKKMMDNFVRQHPKEEIPKEEDLQKVWMEDKLRKMSFEAADIFIYLLLFCTKNNINLWQVVQQKFNIVSEQMGAPEFKI